MGMDVGIVQIQCKEHDDHVLQSFCRLLCELCVQVVKSCHPGLGAKEMDKNEEYLESIEQRLLQKVGLQEPDISKLTRLTQIDNSFHH